MILLYGGDNMLFLKEANFGDWKEEFEAISKIPAMESGFENVYYGVSEEKFKSEVIQELVNHSNGIGLKERICARYIFFSMG